MIKRILGIIKIIRGVIGIVLCSVAITGAGYAGVLSILFPTWIAELLNVSIVNPATVVFWGLGVFFIGCALFAAVIGLRATAEGPMGRAGIAILIGLIAGEIVLIILAVR